MNKHVSDKIATFLLWFAALNVVVVLGVLIADILIKGIPVINFKFIFTSPQGVKMEGGIFPTIVATLYLTILSGIIAAPISIGAAIYLSEYAKQGRIVRLIRFGADSLASVPSIVFGLFGLLLFVNILKLDVSMLSGALTLSFMVLPILVRTTEEALKAVPRSYREGSLGLGATKWQTIRKVVLPPAVPRILTGIILGMGRIFGETAAVMFTAGLAINTPIFPNEPGRNMTNHLYLLSAEGISMDMAYGTAVLLLVVIFSFIIIARRMSTR